MIRRLLRALLPRRQPTYRTAPPVKNPERLRHTWPLFIGSDFRDVDWLAMQHAHRNDNRRAVKRRPF